MNCRQAFTSKDDEDLHERMNEYTNENARMEMERELYAAPQRTMELQRLSDMAVMQMQMMQMMNPPWK